MNSAASGAFCMLVVAIRNDDSIACVYKSPRSRPPTAYCSSTACGDGHTCGIIGGASLCLKPCTSIGDCRDGYQCFGSACVPKCSTDGDCGLGFQCAAGGLCMPYDGVPVGGACGGDPDCSTRYCLLGTCAVPCSRDAACQSGETCALNV